MGNTGQNQIMSQVFPPVIALNQINLVVQDLVTSLRFYRQLGLTIDEAAQADWARHHATAIMPNGVRLELDSAKFARQWNPGWSSSPGGSGCVLFFGVQSREEVDQIFESLTGTGSPCQQPPKDAFWGARYAIIEDPDGNAVGIMSPIDPARRRMPPPPA
ncbi:MAG: VOC family protein [Vulcanimicrobiaceae bacterium]